MPDEAPCTCSGDPNYFDPHCPAHGKRVVSASVDFLRWLVSDLGYTADQIIDVIEKPWHYEDVYAQYEAAGGVDR